jgi:hypothetical protein
MAVNIGDTYVTLYEAEVGCDICGCEWVAVWPPCVERLECPDCGYMNAAPPVTAEEGDYGEDDDGEGRYANA